MRIWQEKDNNVYRALVRRKQISLTEEKDNGFAFAG